LQATGHKRADRFREAQKIAIIRHKFGVHLGNPGSNGFSGKSMAPSLIASTASGISPCASAFLPDKKPML